MRSNKWEGEDEEEEVKDSWEDVEEEKKDVEKPAEAPKTKSKPKKALAERIEEREKKAKEEAEQKTKEKEEALTPEERRIEILRRQRLQEEADLRLAMETFGVTGVTGVTEVANESLDTMVPDTKEEFERFGTALLQKINQFNKHAEFPALAEELIKSIALNLSSNYLKKVKTIVDNLFIEKQKMEKGDKAKKNKGKGKAKLKIEGDNTLLSEYGDYVYDEFDDFM
ncbi:eukaryotic translation initiation factor 3 subunit j [Lasius niger]|uniref:Eukaryotic translation initiation factor 3 subunit J n=2 Tax=Lasius TaxID=488720 RepID=A0A0J7NVY5_LASNI|nr:eukaryotic translation initiation factor 3 subunit j [Lasius niger]